MQRHFSILHSNILRSSIPSLALTSLFISGVMCTFPQRASAQSSTQSSAQPNDSTKKIRWTQIITAVDRHPLLKQQGLKKDLNKANIEDARGIPNPSLEVTLARGKSDETDTTALEWGATLTIPVDWLATRRAGTRVAEAEAAMTDIERTILRQNVIAELRDLFWLTAYQQEKSLALTELRDQTARLTQLIQKRVETGDARPTELTRMQIEEEKVSLALEESQMQMHSLQSEMGLWIGVNGRVICDAPLAFSQNNAPQVSANLLASHPAIERVHQQIKVNDARIRMEKQSRFPDMAMSVFTENELDKTAIGAGLAISIPLWNFNTGPIHRAMAQKAMQEAEIDVQRLSLERRRLQVNASCQTRFHVAKAFDTRILPKVVDVASKVERAYVLGEATLLEVLDARRSVLDARTQLMDARLQARLDCGKVQDLKGEE